MLSQSRSRVRGLITWRMPTICTQRGVMGPARNLCYWALERRHMLRWRVSFVLGLVACTGCAGAYTSPPLTTQHPAHPEATATPELPPSNTLAYRPADIPSSQPAAAAQRGGQGAPPSDKKGAQTVVGEGKVIAVVPASSEIVLAHGEIKGFMDAMTMGYPVQPPSLLERVQAGDAVRFTIDTEEKAIVTLEKLPQ
jgi:Cu(I)/Ag(I) efflux system periplasmic protein CusF